jgi:putative intracellular protease/amidase
MKVLIVMTSHDQLGDTGKKTGVWLEEFAAPYYVFKDAVHVVLASPKGGQPPIDPRSEQPEAQTPATMRFRSDKAAQAAFASTRKLAEVSPEDFDAVFYPGGHGPLWDLAEDQNSIKLIERMYAGGKPVAAVCHGPAAFRHPKAPDGSHLVKGKSVTGFSNTEEAAVGLTHVVPFLVEDMLKQNGGRYSKGADWQPYAVVDGNLITGQNPASAEGTGWLLLDRLIGREAAESARQSANAAAAAAAAAAAGTGGDQSLGAGPR